jgi:hypothetical protein
MDELDLDDSTIPDERLGLIFTCCHPALAVEAQVALTLRTLGGLTTPRSTARSRSPSGGSSLSGWPASEQMRAVARWASGLLEAQGM